MPPSPRPGLEVLTPPRGWPRQAVSLYDAIEITDDQAPTTPVP